MSIESDKDRREKRVRFRSNIQYEKILKDGSLSIPISTTAVDITLRGIGFYSAETLELNSKVRIKLSRLGKNEVSYIGWVRRMEISNTPGMKYIIGVEVEEISDECRMQLADFLKGTDLVRILDTIRLEKVVDIHFVAGYPPIIKKIGSLEILDTEPLNKEVLQTALLEPLDEKQYKKFIDEKEYNFVFNHRGKNRFRVNIHIQRGKVEGTFRLIPSESRVPSQLGLPPIVEKFLENKKGLILIAGRTGAGKTTTLASMVEFINKRKQSIIITIEDPVEYLHKDIKSIIKQREVGKDTLSFSSAAKNALRQNPDVLVIGEILDMKTMEVAISAAEAGILVLSSIHGATSIQALDRVASFFPADMQKHILSRLSLMLKGVITQELLPSQDGEELLIATEVLVMNNPMKHLVRGGEWSQIPSVIETGKSAGMQSMEDSVMKYYRDGLISGEYIKEYVKE